MVRIRFALVLYFRMVAHKATCRTLSKAFIKSMMTCYRFCQCWKYFSHRILRLKISSLAPISAPNQACPSFIISSAWGLSLFKMTFSTQHEFARMTDEADRSDRATSCLFSECNNQRLSPWGMPISCSPDPVTDLC